MSNHDIIEKEMLIAQNKVYEGFKIPDYLLMPDGKAGITEETTWAQFKKCNDIKDSAHNK